jgi:hypothetical protein
LARVRLAFGRVFSLTDVAASGTQFAVAKVESPAREKVAKRVSLGRFPFKEGKQAVKMTRLSCHRFRANEVRLWLSLIVYNLGNLYGGWCCR